MRQHLRTRAFAGTLDLAPGGEIVFGTRFVIASLAVWRVAHLVVEEDGPADVIVRLRRRAGSGQLGQLMDCFYCVSLWSAVPAAFVVARGRRDAPCVALALSGAACLLERVTAECNPHDSVETHTN
jgi:Protein of unknown function (DUF1360)